MKAALEDRRRDRRAETRARRRRRRRALRWGLLALLLLTAAGAGLALTHGDKPARHGVGSSGEAAQAHRPKPTPPLVPPKPIPGYLLIADRGNDRMLLVDGRKRVLWQYPRPHRQPAMPLRFDDDTFFGPGRRTVITNQEEQQTIQAISFPSGRVVWRYGHVNVKGSSPGYLNTPDDAYLLPNGLRSVADAYNCRVLFISRAGRIVRQYGTTGVCRHDPPRYLGAVNGATPLADGGTLVSEITGSWIDDIAPNGELRWAVQAPISYPSDAQLLSPDRFLVADYTRPGRAIIMTRSGHVLWSYGPTTGQGMLDHPSLALRIAPGLIAINDDYRDRIVLVSIPKRRIVWQYGRTDAAGRAHDRLNTPDGLDLLTTAAAQRSRVIQGLLRHSLGLAPPRRPSHGQSTTSSRSGRSGGASSPSS